MPELPEVETIRRILDKSLPGKKIKAVTLRKDKMLRCTSRTEFIRGLQKRQVRSVDRRGKFLLIRLDQDILLLHLGMSGQISIEQSDLKDKHIHFILDFYDGIHLFLRDPRMFGRIDLITEKEERSIFAHLGPEPFSDDFTPEKFRIFLKGRKASIKSLLLNQHPVAGVGNIYADEALFRAGIKPQTKGESISAAQAKKLHAAIRSVLQEAIHSGGTSISDYLDPRNRKGTFQLKLKVYGRSGKPCPKCGTDIQKDIVSQRGTHWCPKCQK